MKKVLLILMAVALSFGIMACDSPPEAKPTTTLSLDQVSTRLGNVENRLAQAESKLSTSTNTEIVAQINSLKTDVAQLKNDLAGMETIDLTGILQDIENINNNIGVIGEQIDYADIDGLRAQIEAIETPDLSELNNKVAALEVSVGNLFDWIDELKIPNVSSIEDDIDDLQSLIGTVEADITTIKSVYAKYTDVQALESNLQMQIDGINNRISALEVGKLAYISKVRSTYLEFTTLASGDYYLILTLYGTNTSGTLTIPDDIDVLLDIDYITERTMLLKANSGSWTANRIVEIGYGGINILAAEIRSCPR